MARIFRGHPFIVIPDVITSLSRERVMVSEYVHGTGFEELKRYPHEDRDRIGEILFRFYFGSLYRHHQFSGDPHPGNSALLDDGRMVFFDFGLFKRMPPGAVELEIQVARAIIEGDTDTIMRLGSEIGFFPEPDKFDPQRVLAHFRAATSWYTVDQYTELTPDYATQVLIDMSDPRSEYFGQLRHESAPPDHIFGRRMEVLTLAVLAQLHARGNFHRIAREWFYDDPHQLAKPSSGAALRGSGDRLLRATRITRKESPRVESGRAGAVLEARGRAARPALGRAERGTPRRLAALIKPAGSGTGWSFRGDRMATRR